jgi:stearoyl-CoA desaturase (delta-9 desaturase)
MLPTGTMISPARTDLVLPSPARRIRLRRAGYRVLVVITVFLPILATFFAIWRLWGEMIGATDLALFIGFYVATGMGVSIGYHRMMSHSSFACGPALKSTFLILGTMAGQGRPIEWAAHHRKHHAFSDRKGDPHSPVDGFVHAYFGWILRGPAAERERYCKRLLQDRLVVFIDRTAAVWVLLGLAIPFAIAGWSGLLWGGFARMAFFSQVAYSVNSFGHCFGSRAFETRDESRNNWILAVLAFGDGWHNNHHAFPSMAYHGTRRREIDMSGMVIRALLTLGLVWNVRLPHPRLLERRRRTTPQVETAR